MSIYSGRNDSYFNQINFRPSSFMAQDFLLNKEDWILCGSAGDAPKINGPGNLIIGNGTGDIAYRNKVKLQGDWEIIVKLKFTSVGLDGGICFNVGANNSTDKDNGMMIQIGTNRNFYVRASGSWTSLATYSTNAITMVTDTWYWIKITKYHKTYSLYISTNGSWGGTTSKGSYTESWASPVMSEGYLGFRPNSCSMEIDYITVTGGVIYQNNSCVAQHNFPQMTLATNPLADSSNYLGWAAVAPHSLSVSSNVLTKTFSGTSNFLAFYNNAFLLTGDWDIELEGQYFSYYENIAFLCQDNSNYYCITSDNSSAPLVSVILNKVVGGTKTSLGTLYTFSDLSATPTITQIKKRGNSFFVRYYSISTLDSISAIITDTTFSTGYIGYTAMARNRSSGAIPMPTTMISSNTQHILDFINYPTYQYAKGIEALYFNGTNQYVDYPDFIWGNTGAYGGPITICWWQKCNIGDLGGYQMAFCCKQSDTSNRFCVFSPWPGTSSFDWYYGNNTVSSVSYNSYFNKWTHCAVVSAGRSGNFRGIYLDGQLATSTASSDGPNLLISGMTIAKDKDSANYFKGWISDFKIFGRVVPAQEIRKIWKDTYRF